MSTTPRLHRLRHGFSLFGLLTILALGGAVALAVAYFVRPMLSNQPEEAGALTDRVKQGLFTHDVTERGEIESSSNVEVRCEVQSRSGSGGSGGSTSIIEIIPEGSVVKEGDFLVKLDDSALQNERTQQQIVVSTSEATVIQQQSVVETAKIAKREYEEGTFRQEEELLQSEIFVAEENLRRAQEYARHSQRLAAKGYVTPVQLEADRFAVKKAETELSLANTKLSVLKNFTKAKMLEQLQADIKSAEAKLKADQESYQLDAGKLKLIESQITKCVIKAPSDGQVVYANENGNRGGNEIIIQEGTAVRERQVIIRLPDPTRMQVKARINESRVDFVREGLPVVIHLDALPGTELRGTVRRVSDYPIASGWFGNSVKEYATFIEIHDPPKAMRPGMTAEVSVRVEQIPDALQLPVQAVFERAGRQWCLTPGDDGKLAAREVKIGTTNDKFVVIKEGLHKDDVVLSNPRKYLNQVDLPAEAESKPQEMLAAMPPPAEGADKPKPRSEAATAAKPRDPPAAASKPGERGAGGPPGAAGGARDPAAMVGMMMERMDTNQDGKLDEAELASLPEQARAGFKSGDANSDGFIDKNELTTAMRKFRGAGRPPETGGGGGAGP